MPALAIHTIGYRPYAPDDLFAALRDAGATLIVDVRNTAIGPRVKRGYSRDELRVRAALAGIGYRHEQALGVPAQLRRAEDRARIIADYRSWLRAELREPRKLTRQAIEALLDAMVEAGRPCVLCAEDDPADCHRTPVAEEIADLLAERGIVAEVVHIMPPG